jgi:site-specific DNA recombinase
MEREKIKYFLYARRSSDESSDRQVQSIDDQISHLQKIASDLNLNVIEVLTESHSAKMPRQRPVFNEMLERINNGEANGILCWQINRLARNPVDSADVQWLLQQGIIKSIQTIDGERRPEDNAVLFSVESGVSTQYIIDLRKNIKRGLYSKLEKGWLPCQAPFGYKNCPETRTIIKDPDTFPLFRKMWDLMLTGTYSPQQIVNIANNEWGFVTRKTKRQGGKPLSLSGMYKIFNNQFYAGIINYGDQTINGKHESMITLEEFDRVQLLLGKKGIRRPKKKDFAFTGIIKCGECGGSVTAESKDKIIKSTNEMKTFTYYRCTKKKKYIECNQKGCINLNDLEDQILDKLDEYTIMPEFLDMALDILDKNEEQELIKNIKINQINEEKISKIEENLSNLLEIIIEKVIDNETFLEKQRYFKGQLDILKNKSNNSVSTHNKFLKLTKKAFDFSTYARVWFEKGSNQDKRMILEALGSNQTLKDKKLFISINKWLEVIKNGYQTLIDKYNRLELEKIPLNKGQKQQLEYIISQWWRWGELNPRAYNSSE